MGKPQPFEITLTCNYSFAPGEEWHAFVGFRPTKDGFSAWARGSTNYDRSRYNKRIAHIKRKQLDWREACRVLLDTDTGAISGDFENDVSVGGVPGWWHEELLSRCWMTEDRVPHEVKEYLVGLDDQDMEWLLSVLDEDLFSESSVEFLSEFIDMESRSPLDVWEEMNEQDDPTPGRILEYLERGYAAKQAERQQEQDARLAPYKAEMDLMYGSVVASWGKATSWAAGIGLAARKSKLLALLVQFVETNRRLPDAEELEAMKSQSYGANPFGRG